MTIAEMREICSDGRYPDDAVLVYRDSYDNICLVAPDDTVAVPRDFDAVWLRDFHGLSGETKVVWV